MAPVPQRLASGVLVLALLACARAPELAATSRRTRRADRPGACLSVAPEQPLQPALDHAAPGQVLCLGDGTWVGSVVVPRGVGVWGTERSRLKTDGSGTTVLLQDGASLGGVTVDGSGGRFDVLDAAVKVHGDDVRVEGVTVLHSIFGILVEKSKRVTLRGNRVYGSAGPRWGCEETASASGRPTTAWWRTTRSSRPATAWSGTRRATCCAATRCASGRYGVHLMYSHPTGWKRTASWATRSASSPCTAATSWSADNQMLFSRGAAGIGLGMKESGNVTVRGNLLAYNTQGFFLDNSPLVEGDRNVFEHNVVRLSEVGIGFLSSEHDNLFRRNVLRDNTVQVRVDSGGDALGVSWEGNAWSDYAGYDLDGDGVGDLPYELKDLSGALTARHPDLAFLRGTLALALVGVAGEVVPLFAPKPILRDPAPRMNLEVADAD